MQEGGFMADNIKKINPYDYAYTSGRVRALETKLLNSQKTQRLFELTTIDDVSRFLVECGYSASNNPEDSIQRSLSDSYDIINSFLPDKEFIYALLLIHEFHNAKVIIKSLLQTNITKTENQTRDKEIFKILIHPSITEPQKLIEIIREQRYGELANYFVNAIKDSLSEYQTTSDASSIDRIMDNAYFEKLQEIATYLGNDFFKKYCSFRSDSTNLGILLRMRGLKATPSLYQKSLVPGGEVNINKLVSLYNADNDEIRSAFNGTLCEKIAISVTDSANSISISEYGRICDNNLMSLMREANKVLFGPEIAIAYLVVKEMQTKNINIVLTCIRNKIPAEIAKQYMREAF